MPLRSDNEVPYQLNAWYAAASGDEVDHEPFRRLLLGEPVVIFRKKDGTPVALEDRCCHRHAPLSPGRLIDDTIECPYHGLRFDETGLCTHVPGQEAIPRGARIRSFPLVERYGLVWIWMGDAAAADPARIPDWRWAEDPEWSSMQGYFHIGCASALAIDNLMDLSHIGYVHKTTIGSASDGEDAIIDTSADEEKVTVRRWLADRPPSPTYVKKLGSTENVDRWQLIEFRPPCYIRTFKGIGRGLYGRPEFAFDSADAEAPSGTLGVSRGNTCITPETRTSCHYFTVHCHYRETDRAQLDLIWQQTVETLEQDIDILERTQQNMALKPDARMVYIHVDEGVEKARQLARLTAKSEASAAAHGRSATVGG